MNEAFELLDPRNAQAYLKRFSSGAKGKGDALFRLARVQDLVVKQPGMAYEANVKDGVSQVLGREVVTAGRGSNEAVRIELPDLFAQFL